MEGIFWHGIGLLAACLTMFGFVPQIIKILKTNLVRDISFIMLVQTCFGAFLWIVYGLHIQDMIVAGANIVSFTTLVIGIVLYFTYRSPNEIILNNRKNHGGLN